jgi:hypothetical protein
MALQNSKTIPLGKYYRFLGETPVSGSYYKYVGYSKAVYPT